MFLRRHLNTLVINFVSLPTYVNLAHLVLFRSVLVFLSANGVRLFKSEGSCLLLYCVGFFCFVVDI